MEVQRIDYRKQINSCLSGSHILYCRNIEEFYVRGLLLNLIEKMLIKSKNSTLIAVVLSSVIFGAGHIFGVLNQPLLVVVSKVVWTIGMGMFFGMVYKKTNNLWLPIMFHFMINVCALPYCFSSINGYADLTLYIVVKNDSISQTNRSDVRTGYRVQTGIFILCC